jgi:hypothetical protein
MSAQFKSIVAKTNVTPTSNYLYKTLFAMEIIYHILTMVQKLVATKTVSQTSKYTQKKIEA